MFLVVDGERYQVASENLTELLADVTVAAQGSVRAVHARRALGGTAVLLLNAASSIRFEGTDDEVANALSLLLEGPS